MSTRGRDVAVPVGLAAALTWYNNVFGRSPLHRRWYPLLNAGATAAVLALAAADGLTAGDLGLRRDRLRAGCALGAAAAAPVVLGYAAAVGVPAARAPLRDQRAAGLTGPRLAYQVLVRIPVGTVAWEEVAFRAVLDGALRRVLPRRAAIAASSVVFGAWHVRPTAEALSLNGLAPGRAARVRAVASGVAGTAAAGALLSALRDRSGSLAAPLIVHLAANCGAQVASVLVARLDRTNPGREMITVIQGLQATARGLSWNSGCTSRTSPGTAGPPSWGRGWPGTRRTPRTRGSPGSP